MATNEVLLKLKIRFSYAICVLLLRVSGHAGSLILELQATVVSTNLILTVLLLFFCFLSNMFFHFLIQLFFDLFDLISAVFVFDQLGPADDGREVLAQSSALCRGRLFRAVLIVL